MRFAAIIMFSLLSISCIGKTNGDPTNIQKPGPINAQRVQSIIDFIERHRGDAPDIKISANDPILGSREDEHAYRVRPGIEGALHENLKRHCGTNGWYYFATLKAFGIDQKQDAGAYARAFVNTFNEALIAKGFVEASPNPWPTIVLEKGIDANSKMMIWVSYFEEADGIWITMQIGVNPKSSPGLMKLVK